jgi:DNA polymerase III sliding clamp (beta) subunit (PCNA family)
MRATVAARDLATALAHAALLVDDARIKVQILTAVRLAGGGGEIEISANVLDFALTMTVPAEIEVAGELVVPGVRLAALAAGFPSGTEIGIVGDDKGARITGGRSRFRLPAFPPTDLPEPLTLKPETGKVSLAREEALALFQRPFFAIEDSKSRPYLGGLLLHDDDGGLTAVATDGYVLFKLCVPGAAGLAQDHHVVAPAAACRIIGKLLAAEKTSERITLACSKTWLAVAGARFKFTARLLDFTYPD